MAKAAEILAASEIDWSRLIRPDDLVMWPEGAGEPLLLTRSLAAALPRLGGVRFFLGVFVSDTLAEATPDQARIYSYGAYGGLMSLFGKGMVEVVPCHYSEVHRFIEDGILAPDVVLVQVTPPDDAGRHSLGTGVGYILSAIAQARMVIAQINPDLPWTDGASVVSADNFHYVVPAAHPVLEFPARAPSAAEQAIAEQIARLVPDRATIQMGIGALPDAIAAGLAAKRDLGVHSGIVTDAVRALVLAGAVTNRFKEVDTGHLVTGGLLGTRPLYDFAHRNAALRMAPSSHTHSRAVLDQIDTLYAMNAAIEVDLTGQVNAEAVGRRYLGQTGGQGDFQRAAVASRHGRGIIALPSTTPDGRTSRIVPRLSGPVTTPRSDVDIIVTEQGMAELRGLTLSQRVEAMLAIAHPDHRRDLAAGLDALY